PRSRCRHSRALRSGGFLSRTRHSQRGITGPEPQQARGEVLSQSWISCPAAESDADGSACRRKTPAAASYRKYASVMYCCTMRWVLKNDPLMAIECCMIER